MEKFLEKQGRQTPNKGKGGSDIDSEAGSEEDYQRLGSSQERFGLRKTFSKCSFLGQTERDSSYGSLPLHDSDAYSEWLVEYPSMLERFSEFLEKAAGKRLALFLDYDGTLTPIVNDPNCAFMPEDTRAVLKELATVVPTAIISGRCLEKVESFVQLNELFYAGSHGLDIKGPQEGQYALVDPTTCDYQPAVRYLAIMDDVHDRLVAEVSTIAGASVEHNKYSVSTHYRNCNPVDWDDVREVVQRLVDSSSDLRITQGKKVFEIRPNVAWNKGKALLFLMERLDLAHSADTLPVYIGDDRTDEDAFQVLRESGKGISILVSRKPRETCAQYTLRDPSEVLVFLRHLEVWAACEDGQAELTSEQVSAAAAVPLPPSPSNTSASADSQWGSVERTERTSDRSIGSYEGP